MTLSASHRLTITLLTIIMIAIAGASTAHAIPMSYKLKKYNELVHRAIAGGEETPHFYMQLRRYYSDIDDFDPDGSEIVEEMNSLAPLVKPQSQEPDDLIIFENFKRIILTHLGNITVAENAMYLAQKYPNILNHARMKNVFYGLYNSLTISGNGSTKRTAYDLFTLSEEAMLLEKLGMRSDFRGQEQEGLRMYAVHQVTNMKTGGPRTIYMNISAYGQKLIDQQEEEANKSEPISIGR
ncbi:MAG: hypothetical protein CL570_06910 [Alphaproteobacteria bacterium]|nr:hypothetical protein [Alphaproteobacteria bacterium]HCQ71780.1 hypothetical protein [Rhodospirillaceae bacterium]